MSLHPQAIPPIPEETARVAHAVLPHGSLYLQMRDTLGTLYQDDDFLDLFPTRGQPAEAPWRLALEIISKRISERTDDTRAADTRV